MNSAIWNQIVKHGINSAIHCPLKEQSLEVLKIIKEKSGRTFLDGRETHWDFYKEDTCYYPNIGVSDRKYMQYSDLAWAVENKMVIFAAADLLMDDDLPISASEINIESLFGME